MCYEISLGETVKMLQTFNRVVHQDFDKEVRMNKKLTLAVAATAVAGLIALVGASLFSHSGAASQPTIQGVWRVTEVTTTGKGAATNKSPNQACTSSRQNITASSV